MLCRVCGREIIFDGYADPKLRALMGDVWRKAIDRSYSCYFGTNGVYYGHIPTYEQQSI